VRKETESWIGIELRHFAALEAVVEEASFNKAAQRLGYTQSAVSQQIAALERAVGQKLVERRGRARPVAPTEAGRRLLAHVRAIASRLDAAQEELAALASGQQGVLRVGLYPSVGASLFPMVLQTFSRAWSEVSLELTETVADPELFRLLERESIDLAFVILPPAAGQFDYVELVQDPYVLVASRRSPLAAERRAPQLSDLDQLPIVCFNQCRSCDEVISVIRALGVEPNIVLRSDDAGTVQGLVRAGFGYGLLPSLAVDASDETLVRIPLGDQLPPRRSGLAWLRRSHPTGAAEAFVNVAREVSRIGSQPRLVPARRAS
jgi:DNA-binding transcriptional LysR family regulator